MIVVLTVGLLAVSAAIALGQGAEEDLSIRSVERGRDKGSAGVPGSGQTVEAYGKRRNGRLDRENGSVETVTPISGNPVLTKPAADALKKWKFKPFASDGTPVKAEAALKINFGS